MAKESTGTNLGVVATPDGIVAAVARERAGGVEVVSWGVIGAPPGSMDGAAVTDPGRVGQAIKTLVSRVTGKSRAASMAIRAPGYAMRTLRLPDVQDQEQKILVRGELEDAAAIPVGGGAFDFVWVPVTTPDGKRQADASAYYTSEAVVESAESTMRAAGIDLAAMEPASLSMMRAYIASSTTRRPIALLCPSDSHTDLCIHDGAAIRQVRRIPAGWNDLADLTAEQAAPEKLLGRPGEEVRPMPEGVPAASGIWSEFGDFPEVEQDEERQGPRIGAPAARPSPPKPGASQTGSMYMSPDLESPQAALERTSSSAFLSSEVGRTLAFYTRENPDAPRPEAVVVLGPAEVVRNFRTVLSMSLPIPVSGVDPLAGLTLPPPVMGDSASDVPDLVLAAVGIALAGSGVAAIPLVDISQVELASRTRKRAPALMLAGMAGSTLWMVAAAAAAITLTFLESSAQGEHARIVSQIDQIKKDREPKLKYAAMVDAVKAEQAKSKVPAESALGRAAASATPGVGLTALKVTKDGKVALEGWARNSGTMQEFMALVGRGKVTSNPQYEQFRQNDKGELTFVVTSKFRSEKLQ